MKDRTSYYLCHCPQIWRTKYQAIGIRTFSKAVLVERNYTMSAAVAPKESNGSLETYYASKIGELSEVGYEIPIRNG